MYEIWLLVLVGSSTVIVALLFLIFILIYILTNPEPNIDYTEDELHYVDVCDENKLKPFPSIRENGSIDLTVVVPAYNEEKRLPAMMTEALEYLELRCKKNEKFRYEIIIVDDGSSDATTSVGHKYCKKFGTEKIRVLTLLRNRGKGGAVRAGVLSSRGLLCLFADADGATKFSDFDKLELKLKSMISVINDNKIVVCGSRHHLQSESIVKRSILRTILMVGFHWLVRSLCVRSVKDTQCGFKLFTRSSMRLLFRNLHVERWAFDVDLLYLAEYFHIPVFEIPVSWQEIPGTKLIPVFSWLQMGKDILMIRLRYFLGAWKIERKLEWH